MKKWLIGIAIVAAIIVIIYLDQSGVIKWQPLSMIVAAIAGPFKLLLGMTSNTEKKIHEKHDAIRQKEAGYQSQLEGRIQDTQTRVEIFKQQIQTIDQELELLKKKRAKVDDIVDKMNIEERREAGRRYFGS